jgi:hypothetical protein
MPKRTAFNRERLQQTLQAQHHVISRQQALSCRVPRRTLDHWTAPGGRWQRLLPGVYAAVTGTVTSDQRHMAALLYAGADSVITGSAAMRLHRLHPAGPDTVDVLVPAKTKRQSVGFVRIHRTTRMPADENVYKTDLIHFAPPARAAADAARGFKKFDDVRDVVSQVVQRQACTVQELISELRDGPSAGSLLLSAALAELGDGIRSVAEANLRNLIRASSLPEPMFNARLYKLDGAFLGMVDAWWDDAGVAAEVDSRAYHLSPADQDSDVERHDRLIAQGVLLQHFSPRRIKTEGAVVLSDIGTAIVSGRNRARLPIIALPADSRWADYLAQRELVSVAG